MLRETRQVALFIDFANIRYAYLKTYGCEPQPLELMGIARDYGCVVTAVAYADFTGHLASFRRSLEVAGIVPLDTPKRNAGSPKTAARVAMFMDVIDSLLDRPDVEVYVLMTGLGDFVRVVARARHRFGKTVVVAGVPGAVSQGLIDSADDMVPLVSQQSVKHAEEATTGASQTVDLPAGVSEDEAKLVRLIDYLERNRPYLTFRFVHSYAVNPAGQLRMADAEVTELLDRFVEDGLLIPYERRLSDGRVVVNVRLNYHHPVPQQLLGPSQ